MKYSLLSLPIEDRPRERFLKFGPEVMQTAELIAIILGTGTKDFSVMEISELLISHFQTLEQLAQATVSELMAIKGVGKAKALQINAVFALAKRMTQQGVHFRQKIEHPIHVFRLFKNKFFSEKRECFYAIYLDDKGYILKEMLISIGALTETLVHPREVVYPAIRHQASSVILIHSHPSGEVQPSIEDIETTKTLIKTGQIIGIEVQDHLIIGNNCFFSFKEKSLLFN